MSAVKSMPGTDAGELVVKSPGRNRILYVLTGLTVAAVGVGLLLSLFYAETEVVQGDVQRIFYVHMASYFAATVAFASAVFGGVQYLRTRNNKWDTLALAGIEVGLTLALVNLATGSVWARPIWNTWWTWDPRLTTAAISALTYAAYLMLRAGIENPDTRRRFASVYAILAFTTVVLTIVIIRIRPDTIHPAAIGPSPQDAEGTFEASSSMQTTLVYHLVVWITLVPIVLMWWRIRLQNLSDHVDALKVRALGE